MRTPIRCTLTGICSTTPCTWRRASLIIASCHRRAAYSGLPRLALLHRSMMNPNPAKWTVFDAEMPILTYEYSFGPGTSKSLAVGGNGGLIVVSPPCRVAQSVYDDLER